MMAKSKLTLDIESALDRHLSSQSTFGCPEVTIGWFGKERVDYMAINAGKGIVRCYEIKVSKSDFRSPAAHTFVGHYNYYVLPWELYKEIKKEIPEGIGVYIYKDIGIGLERKAKRQEPKCSVEELKSYFIRSLRRELDTYRDLATGVTCDRLKEELSWYKGQHKMLVETDRELSWYRTAVRHLFGTDGLCEVRDYIDEHKEDA
jgi:hypothetical protein